MVLVSACLAGLDTRYDGTSCGRSDIISLVSRGNAIPVCPEQLGGLPTPREPIELAGGDGESLLRGEATAVGKESGRDYTQNLLRGSREVLKIAKMLKVKKVLLKDGSPSCGSNYIKRGKRRVKGKGVTAAMLLDAGIKVESENKKS
jgi:uncharacterized protein YbbK (DUF523 family)